MLIGSIVAVVMVVNGLAGPVLVESSRPLGYWCGPMNHPMNDRCCNYEGTCSMEEELEAHRLEQRRFLGEQAGGTAP